MDHAISARRVTKTYALGAVATRALDGVDLDVHCGEMVMLMGPSGSGKTTLLSIMGCILTPTSGSLRVLGREVADLDERERPAIRLHSIGFIFQAFRLFSTLTAVENVELALNLKGIRGRAGRLAAARLMEQVSLSDKHRAFPADLSGGQQQRVAIARALAGNPRIILADEPTAALDSSSGYAVMEILRGLARQGSAVVTVTHDPRILSYADRVVRLEDGKVLAEENAAPQPAGEIP